jgi:hypothetical protein
MRVVLGKHTLNGRFEEFSMVVARGYNRYQG